MAFSFFSDARSNDSTPTQSEAINNTEIDVDNKVDEDDVDEDDVDEEDFEEEPDNFNASTDFVLEYAMDYVNVTKASHPGNLAEVASQYASQLGLPEDLGRLRFRDNSQYLEPNVEPQVGQIYVLSVGHNVKGY